jgi:hypothetical protein
VDAALVPSDAFAGDWEVFIKNRGFNSLISASKRGLPTSIIADESIRGSLLAGFVEANQSAAANKGGWEHKDLFRLTEKVFKPRN